MSTLDQHLLLCDPLPEWEVKTSGWKRAIRGIARIILESQHPSPVEAAEILAQIAVQGRLGSDPFSSNAARAVAKALPDSPGCNGLFGSVCVMSAAVRVLASRQLRARPKVSRRDSIALALWSALSFQRPLGEQRLEDIRAEMLTSARRAGLKLARISRLRRRPQKGASPGIQYWALRWNAVLDQEEIKVLRWTLSDESALLERPYAEVGPDETVALAQGLELGGLLTKFPVFEHYELASRDIAQGHETDLGGLLDAVGEDRNALAAPFEDNPVIGACPSVFPLLTALTGRPTADADATVARSLADWCGRALIESAVLKHSERDAEGS